MPVKGGAAAPFTVGGTVVGNILPITGGVSRCPVVAMKGSGGGGGK